MLWLGFLPGFPDFAARRPFAMIAPDVSAEAAMAQCESCGNDYDKSFDVILGGVTHTFDCFECAIHALAPGCDRCGCKIIGHGVEGDGVVYCSASCAKQSGIARVRDRVDSKAASA
jgi:hypothetical protein